MKTFLSTLALFSFIAMSAFSAEVSDIQEKEVTLGKGIFQETYTPVSAFGITFRCMVLKPSNFIWKVAEEDMEQMSKIQDPMVKELSKRVALEKSSDPEFCKKNAWMRSARHEQERATLNGLAFSVYARLISLTGGNIDEKVLESDENIKECFEGLVDLENINQMVTQCK